MIKTRDLISFLSCRERVEPSRLTKIVVRIIKEARLFIQIKELKIADGIANARTADKTAI